MVDLPKAVVQPERVFVADKPGIVEPAPDGLATGALLVNTEALTQYLADRTGGFSVGGYTSPTQVILDILQRSTGKVYTQHASSLLQALRTPTSQEAAILNGLAGLGVYNNPVRALARQHQTTAAEAFAASLEAELKQGLEQVGRRYLEDRANAFIGLVDNSADEILTGLKAAITSASTGEVGSKWEKLYKNQFPYSLEFALAAQVPIAIAELRAMSDADRDAAADMAQRAIDHGNGHYLGLTDKLALAEKRSPGTLDAIAAAFTKAGGVYADVVQAVNAADDATRATIKDASGFAMLHVQNVNQELVGPIMQSAHYLADIPSIRGGYRIDFGAEFKAKHNAELDVAIVKKGREGDTARAFARDKYMAKYGDTQIRQFTETFFSKAGLATVRRVINESTETFPDLFDVVGKINEGGSQVSYSQAVRDQATLAQLGQFDEKAPPYHLKWRSQGHGSDEQIGR